MKKKILLILTFFLIISCQTIKENNYRNLKNSTKTLNENCGELLNNIEDLEKENYIDAVYNNQKEIYDIKNDINNERKEIFLDKIKNTHYEISNINNLLYSYSKLLYSIASNEKYEIEENVLKFLNAFDELEESTDFINENNENIFSGTLLELENLYKIRMLEILIKKNEKLIEKVSQLGLSNLEKIEELNFIVYEKRFADVYEQYLLNKDKELLKYLLKLNNIYKNNCLYINNAKAIYEQLPEYHKNIMKEISFIDYSIKVSGRF